MTTMAGMAFLETPERVLKRVQQLEDVELPSLPSFSHEVDFESEYDESERSDKSGMVIGDEDMDAPTPHPKRQLTQAPEVSPGDSSTSTDVPYPPLDLSNARSDDYTAPGSAVTSTPLTKSGSKSSARSVKTDRTREMGNSTKVSSSRWQTPGDMSYSFSGEEILRDELDDDLGSERSVPLNDASSRMNKSSTGTSVLSTPITKRLNPNHVTLDRPRRRVTSGPSQLSAYLDSSTKLATSTGTRPILRSPASSPSAPPVPSGDRIPSLTRSEISAPETSVGATTPEGPSRRIAVLTPRSEGVSHNQDQDDMSQDLSEAHNWSEDNEDAGDHELEGHSQIGELEPSQLPEEVSQAYASPAKLGASVSYGQFSTPGMGRDAPSGTLSPHSMSNLGESGMMSSFHDKTHGGSHVPFQPFTPTPAGLQSHYGNLTTPRAPLDDAERRKSHVLAVLGSSGLPTRTPRSVYKGTPHPLRRVSVAPLSESITEEGTPGSQRASTVTPGGRTFLSAGDPGMQSMNDSFVSIASSADLTSDKRASHFPSRVSRGNTSFPNILLPGSVSQNSPGGSLRGVSDQRANGVKIHKHLNAMNKQLLETNADLAREAEAWRDEVERLKGVLNEAGVEVEEVDVLGRLPERSQADISLPSILRRSRYDTPAADSSVGSMAKLERSRSAPMEGEHEQTAILTEMAEKLESLEEVLAEKDELIADLEQRLESADGDRASGIDEDAQRRIEDLNRQLEEAEQLRETLHADFAQKTEQHAQRFGEICTGFEEQVKTLEGQLESSRNESERLRGDKARLEEMASAASMDEREKEWRKQVTGLEVDLGRAKEEARTKAAEVDSLHKEVDLRRAESSGLQQQLDSTRGELKSLSTEREQESRSNPQRDQELESARTKIQELEQKLNAAHDEIDTLRQECNERQQELDHNQEEIKALAGQLDTLEQRDTPQDGDKEEIDRLHAMVEDTDLALADKEAELEQLRARLQTMELRQSTIDSPNRRDQSEARDDDDANSSFIAGLEQRLDEAHHTIGRLQHELNATPRRMGVIEVREARIKALESEKAALTERLAVKETSVLVANSLQGAVSPFKATPFVHRAIASLKTPRTPGPLKEYSWLQSSIGDANEPVLRAQMEYLQDELMNANEQLDNNFSRLESAGFGALALAEKLAKANERIGELEEQIRGLSQRNKASLALVTAQREEDNREHEDHLQNALTEMKQQMDDLKADLATERSRLQRDNQRLQDLLSEINLKRQAEVDSFRAEMGRMEEDAEVNLEEARRESSGLTLQIDRLKQEKQSSVAKIEQLEHDLSLQLDAYDDLQARFARQEADRDLQNELQVQLGRITLLETTLQEGNLATDRLRQNLRDKSDALQHAESKIETLQRERKSVAKELQAFEGDLQRQRIESEGFGKELQKLRLEQQNTSQSQDQFEQMRRDYKTARESLRHAKDQLAKAVDRVTELEEWQRTHRYDQENSSQAMTEQYAHWKSQTRDLAIQIRYLKAKFTREATFRSALSAQKRYFLVMIGGMSLNEQATMKELASMGAPVPPIKREKRTLKHAALAVVSLIRARKLAEKWRSEVQLKAEAVQSHQERRKASGRS